MLTNKAENCVFYGSNYMLLYVKFRLGVVGTVDLRQTEDKQLLADTVAGEAVSELWTEIPP